MKYEGSILFICIAAVICSFAGCSAMEAVYGPGHVARESAEVVCAKQWWHNDFCRSLAARRTP
jgi:hypothetical protein